MNETADPSSPGDSPKPYAKLDLRYFSPLTLAIRDRLLGQIRAANTDAELMMKLENLGLDHVRDDMRRAIALGPEECVLLLLRDMAAVAVKLDTIERGQR
jgi:hypothetical protein